MLTLAALVGFAAPVSSAGQPAAAPTCDRLAVVAATMAKLGEQASSFTIVTPAQMKAQGPERAAAYATETAVVYSDGIPCRYLPAVVAHELAHVWQARKYGTMARAERAYGAELEPVADCVAVATGWEFYRPYLEARGYGCTEYERAATSGLRRWAR
ncbi:hypothetical protein [Amycolatopsis sp. FDAARGOS 1241]|uniref:hypothetical protein n=1 Tax=Amycolatopsis sp. FDAARGOS 1241 TaxID=2778070 RepID=UPI0019504EE6|nr:hypothetical protein [Amycolatopsis sp. FDAARGOS 1241]QRP48022.1 hypothetical protein I6J71_09100 [Amycolatopsis sp. FDAARGOS 1241]